MYRVNPSKKRETFKISVLIVFVFLSIINFKPVSNLISYAYNSNHYRYANGDGTMTFIEYEWKGRTWDNGKILPQDIMRKIPSIKDSNVYRLFWRNPLHFWRWAEYIYADKYKIPYKDWEEIKKIRGPIKNRTQVQDF